MKLYLVHAGYYDTEIAEGIYEFHVNFLVAATSFEEARLRAKARPDFQGKRMHVDGLVEIQSVDGFEVTLSENPALQGQSCLISNKHRDLATKPATPSNS